MRGDRETFRRSLLLGLGACAAWTSAASATIALWQPALTAATLSLGTGLLLLQAVWVHGHAQSAARRMEILRSFAGLVVIRNGTAVRIADENHEPLLGEYATRREAAWAAARCGRWAVLVRAYDRYYVLTGRRTSATRAAVSFRQGAVADLVPALYDGALTA